MVKVIRKSKVLNVLIAEFHMAGTTITLSFDGIQDLAQFLRRMQVSETEILAACQ
jgi:hypothetical protein